MDRAVARESRIPTQAGRVSGSTLTKKKKMWRILAGACFAIALLGVFAQPLLALINYAAGSDLYSYILLIPFVSAYLLYLRRNQLPKDYVVDRPLAMAFLAAGFGVLAFRYWLHFVGQSPAKADDLALETVSFLCILAAGGFFFLGRVWMQAAAFPLAYLIFMVPNAGCNGRGAGDRLKICLRGSGKCSFPRHSHAFSSRGSYFPTA